MEAECLSAHPCRISRGGRANARVWILILWRKKRREKRLTRSLQPATSGDQRPLVKCRMRGDHTFPHLKFYKNFCTWHFVEWKVQTSVALCAVRIESASLCYFLCSVWKCNLIAVLVLPLSLPPLSERAEVKPTGTALISAAMMSLKNLYQEGEHCSNAATPLTPITPLQTNPQRPLCHLWRKRNLSRAPWHQNRPIYLPNLITLIHVTLRTVLRKAKQLPKAFWMIRHQLSPAATPACSSQPAPSNPSRLNASSPAPFSTALNSRSQLTAPNRLRTTAAPLALWIRPVQWRQSSLGAIRFLPSSPGATGVQIAPDSPL